MSAWAVGWQELMVLGGCFMLLLLIAGLVMLIVGLSTKKRGLWIAGLCLMLIPVLLVVLGAAMAAIAWRGIEC
jgi:Ca2+/Na+ antiporter